MSAIIAPSTGRLTYGFGGVANTGTSASFFWINVDQVHTVGGLRGNAASYRVAQACTIVDASLSNKAGTGTGSVVYTLWIGAPGAEVNTATIISALATSTSSQATISIALSAGDIISVKINCTGSVTGSMSDPSLTLTCTVP